MKLYTYYIYIYIYIIWWFNQTRWCFDQQNGDLTLFKLGSNHQPLVGGWALALWKMMEFVNGKDDIPYMKWKIIQSCLKPPTSFHDGEWWLIMVQNGSELVDINWLYVWNHQPQKAMNHLTRSDMNPPQFLGQLNPRCQPAIGQPATGNFDMTKIWENPHVQ